MRSNDEDGQRKETLKIKKKTLKINKTFRVLDLIELMKLKDRRTTVVFHPVAVNILSFVTAFKCNEIKNKSFKITSFTKSHESSTKQNQRSTNGQLHTNLYWLAVPSPYWLSRKPTTKHLSKTSVVEARRRTYRRRAASLSHLLKDMVEGSQLVMRETSTPESLILT